MIIHNAPRRQESEDFTRILAAISGLDDLVNTVVEIDEGGEVTRYDWPKVE